jgi:glycine/D-amino acid oxidase-like deaminating enzyme
VADDNLGSVTEPTTVDRTLDLAKRDELGAWLNAIMPNAGFTYVEGSTCMYTLTPDRDFLIGPHPHHANVMVGAGFSGHGFKFSAIVGKLLAELALDQSPSQPIERFRLDRFDR